MNFFFAGAVFLFLAIVNIQDLQANSEILTPQKEEWPFDGVTGKFDRESIQRGFKVYREVCSACHSLKYLSFRNLQDIGFSTDQVKTLASEYTVKDGPNDEGVLYDRSAVISDHLPSPYSNEQEGRIANNGALPPDLSLIIKARPDGPNYVYSILTGYQKAPPNTKLSENMYYNPYFSGGQIAMPPPLTSDGQIEYSDDTEATVSQMSRDVVNFLQWIAEPEMERRKSLGIRVIIFMIIFTVLFYFANKKQWKMLKDK